MIIKNQLVRRRVGLLLLVLIFYGIAFVILNSGFFKTREEISPLIIPKESEYQLPFKPSGLTFDGSNLLVSSAANGLIYVLNPKTGEIIQQFKSPVPSPTGITWDGEYLWLTDLISLKIIKWNAVNDTILSSIKSPGTRPTGLAWNNSNLWVSDPITKSLYQLELNGTVLQFLNLPSPGERPAGLAIKNNELWISDIETSFILQFEPLKQIVSSYYYAPGNYPGSITWIEDHLWVTDYSLNKIFETLPGERVEQITIITVPSWYWPLLFISIIPVILSIIAALETGEVPINTPNQNKKDHNISSKRTHLSLFIIAYIFAIIGSLYSSLEIFRIVYSALILKQKIDIGSAPNYMYNLEMLLCIYTAAFWIYYIIIKGLIPLFKNYKNIRD